MKWKHEKLSTLNKIMEMLKKFTKKTIKNHEKKANFILLEIMTFKLEPHINERQSNWNQNLYCSFRFKINKIIVK